MGESNEAAFITETSVKSKNRFFRGEKFELQRREIRQRREEERNKNVRFGIGTVATAVVAIVHIWLLADLRTAVLAKDSRPITIIMQPPEEAGDIETDAELK